MKSNVGIPLLKRALRAASDFGSFGPSRSIVRDIVIANLFLSLNNHNLDASHPIPAMSLRETALPVSSSVDSGLHADQERLYQDVLRLLAEHRVPYAVSGAFALQEHTGVRRPAKDLDIFLTSETAVLTLDILSKHGFRCEVCDPVWLAKAHRQDFFVDFITGMSNAALIVTDSWLTRAQPAVILGVPTRILAAEELLVSKMFVVRRERFDGADVAHIIYATGGKLDWSRILELAGAHWEMLLWTLVWFRFIYPAQGNYVPFPVWTQLVNRLMLELLNPDPSARFRGSLVDESMFAIDVKEWGLDDLLSEYRACRARDIRWPSDNVEESEARHSE